MLGRNFLIIKNYVALHLEAKAKQVVFEGSPKKFASTTSITCSWKKQEDDGKYLKKPINLC